MGENDEPEVERHADGVVTIQLDSDIHKKLQATELAPVVLTVGELLQIKAAMMITDSLMRGKIDLPLMYQLKQRVMVQAMRKIVDSSHTVYSALASIITEAIAADPSRAEKLTKQLATCQIEHETAIASEEHAWNNMPAELR